MGGFNAWEPIFFYGKMPRGKRLGQDYIRVDTLNFSKGAEKDHPCPKPLKLIQILIDNFSNKMELIADPFMGSWTTARASMDLGRNFIGFEQIKEYCEIGEKRLKQQNLF